MSSYSLIVLYANFEKKTMILVIFFLKGKIYFDLTKLNLQ